MYVTASDSVEAGNEGFEGPHYTPRPCWIVGDVIHDNHVVIASCIWHSIQSLFMLCSLFGTCPHTSNETDTVCTDYGPTQKTTMTSITGRDYPPDLKHPNWWENTDHVIKINLWLHSWGDLADVAGLDLK